MKVIVAGLSKTGTKSLNAALTKLGYSVYDFSENAFLLSDEYRKIVLHGWTTEDFRKMYENVDAVVDFPACFFWDEIHKAFPDAKIILTIRNSEDEWLRSWEKQIQMGDRSPLMRLMEFLSPSFARALQHLSPIGIATFGILPQSPFRRRTVINKQLAKKLYRQHNAYVIHSAPKDKLLVYRCSEGWEPLCKFLEVPAPDQPFPHKNKGGEMVNTIVRDLPLFAKIQREIIVSSCIISSTVVVAGFVVYKYGLTSIVRSLGRNVGEAFKKLNKIC